MALTGWVAKHTGLPSVTPSATGPVYAGDSVLTMVDGATVGIPVSDPLAPIGKPVTYRQGSSTVTLTRAAPTVSVWGLAIVTSANGRTIPGVGWYNDGASVDYSTGVSAQASLGVRWPLVTPLRSGSSHCIINDPAYRDDAITLITSRSPIVLLAPAGVTGMPDVQKVVVSKVAAKRSGMHGENTLQVDWQEYRDVSGPRRVPSVRAGYAAPVVTWREWRDHSPRGGWQDVTYRQLCTDIAGMPS